MCQPAAQEHSPWPAGPDVQESRFRNAQIQRFLRLWFKIMKDFFNVHFRKLFWILNMFDLNLGLVNCNYPAKSACLVLCAAMIIRHKQNKIFDQIVMEQLYKEPPRENASVGDNPLNWKHILYNTQDACSNCK